MVTKFWILKTRENGDFYFGILPNHKINNSEVDQVIWLNNNIMIPYSNIDFFMFGLPFDDFLEYSSRYNLSEYDDARFSRVMAIYDAEN